MNSSKIFLKDWLLLHQHNQIELADDWYVGFSNELLQLVIASDLYDGFPLEQQKMVALLLTTYLEDCVAQEGGWCRFKKTQMELYKRPLPFYTITNDYIEDEVNIEDIQFLLWCFNSGPVEQGVGVVDDPFGDNLIQLANAVYELMIEKFNQAPIGLGDSFDWVVEPNQFQNHLEEKQETSESEVITRFLELTNGNKIHYVYTYKELESLFSEGLNFKDSEESLVELTDFSDFVVLAYQERLIIGVGIAKYFSDRNNIHYSKTKATDEAYVLFCEPRRCPFPILEYAMNHNLLADASLPIPNGNQLLLENWDFIARWYLGDFYGVSY